MGPEASARLKHLAPGRVNPALASDVKRLYRYDCTLAMLVRARILPDMRPQRRPRSGPKPHGLGCGLRPAAHSRRPTVTPARVLSHDLINH